MKKNLLNELNQMKYLFGYQKGRVISEQDNIVDEDDFEEDVMFADPDVMEPEVMPDTDRDVEEKPYRPGRPDRDPSRLPYTDPDTHPQGEYEDDVDFGIELDDDGDDIGYEIEVDDFDFGPEVAPAPTREKERTKEREKTEKPYNPNRRERDPGRLPYTDPDTHPQGRGEHYDDESEPFGGEDMGYETDNKLEDLVMKYLRSKK
jgi:hypothetical protein